jgi:hypothetical protein
MPPGLQLGVSGLLFGKAGASGSFDFVAQVADSSGNISQEPLTLAVTQPGLPPVLTLVEYRRKRIFLSGQGLNDNAVAYVDGESLSTILNGTTLTTTKMKLKTGVHQVYVVNPDGKQSDTVQFIIE